MPPFDVNKFTGNEETKAEQDPQSHAKDIEDKVSKSYFRGRSTA
jgi:hypothetical protein